jgi:hypothetical protein
MAAVVLAVPLLAYLLKPLIHRLMGELVFRGRNS